MILSTVFADPKKFFSALAYFSFDSPHTLSVFVHYSSSVRLNLSQTLLHLFSDNRRLVNNVYFYHLPVFFVNYCLCNSSETLLNDVRESTTQKYEWIILMYSILLRINNHSIDQSFIPSCLTQLEWSPGDEISMLNSIYKGFRSFQSFQSNSEAFLLFFTFFYL